MKIFKYVLRFISLVSAITLPIIFTKDYFDKGNLIVAGICAIILISNVYCMWEIIQLCNRAYPDNEDPIEYMRKKL